MISIFFKSIGFIVLHSFLFLHHNCDGLSQFLIVMLGIFFMPFPNPPSTLLLPALCPERQISWTTGTGALVRTGSCPPPGLGNLCFSLMGAAFGPKSVFHGLSPDLMAFASILSPETVNLCLDTDCGKKGVLTFLHREMALLPLPQQRWRPAALLLRPNSLRLLLPTRGASGAVPVTPAAHATKRRSLSLFTLVTTERSLGVGTNSPCVWSPQLF